MAIGSRASSEEITVTATDWSSGARGTGQYAEVNGINLYFETHGSGRPLILLHGGLGSGEMFGPILPVLAERHQVVTVDLQGHGRTADIDRPIDAALMAGDIAALIGHLGLDKPDVAGYSLGGGVALQTAVSTRTWSAGSSPSRSTSGAARSTRKCSPSRAR
jgi:pimeloyl-ACP methyl ester carboxylesterase